MVFFLDKAKPDTKSKRKKVGSKFQNVKDSTIELKGSIKAHGGSVSLVMTKKVTHVIVLDEAVQILKAGETRVTARWVMDCIEAGEIKQ
jgi:hypothetical protein